MALWGGSAGQLTSEQSAAHPIKTINWSAVLEDRIGDRGEAGQAQARKADQGNHLRHERGAGHGHLYRLAAKATQHHFVD